MYIRKQKNGIYFDESEEKLCNFLLIINKGQLKLYVKNLTLNFYECIVEVV